ncbi:hypothetical protein I5Q34_32580 [Streptomyces sp. AV19]|nr:hypothetical protein [Streptomyces sp. AV19]
MSEQVKVRVLLLFGDQAEIVADVPDPAEPVRYPAAQVAAEAGVEVRALPGMRLWASVGKDDRLTGFRVAE